MMLKWIRQINFSPKFWLSLTNPKAILLGRYTLLLARWECHLRDQYINWFRQLLRIYLHLIRILVDIMRWIPGRWLTQICTLYASRAFSKSLIFRFYQKIIITQRKRSNKCLWQLPYMLRKCYYCPKSEISRICMKLLIIYYFLSLFFFSSSDHRHHHPHSHIFLLRLFVFSLLNSSHQDFFSWISEGPHIYWGRNKTFIKYAYQGCWWCTSRNRLGARSCCWWGWVVVIIT